MDNEERRHNQGTANDVLYPCPIYRSKKNPRCDVWTAQYPTELKKGVLPKNLMTVPPTAKSKREATTVLMQKWSKKGSAKMQEAMKVEKPMVMKSGTMKKKKN